MRIWACIILLCFSISCHAEKLIIEPDMGRAPLLSLISHAKNSIDIVMYGFTDKTFSKALTDAKNNGKNIEILLEKKPYKNENENTSIVRILRANDINVTWANPDFKLTHQKMIMTDNNTALIMTFNLTHSAFDKQRNFALLIDDPDTVNEIKNVFTADRDRKEITVHQRNLVWSPDNSREKLLSFIRNAHASIEIYAQDISDYKTIGALAHAARNGVLVEILTSANKSSKKYNYLQQAGVKIHFSNHYYIHAKVIIVDHNQAMLGSMNLTKSSIDNNRELSVITQDKEVLRQLENTFMHDWDDTKNLLSYHTIKRLFSMKTLKKLI
jgi:cardiolipin synthase